MCTLLQGGAPNDLEGDVCFAELRWAQMQAAKQGRFPQTLIQEFAAAKHAQQQQFAVPSSSNPLKPLS